MTLIDLGVLPNGTVELQVHSADPSNNPIEHFKPQQDYQMPDVITVRVQGVDNSTKDVVVEIERSTRKKTFLGGYRHKISGTEFHHASAQTIPKPRRPTAHEQLTRDTQVSDLE